MTQYNYNYYLSGLFHNNTAYHEKFDTEEDARNAINEIWDTEIDFIENGSQTIRADGVVRLIGLQLIIEIDSIINEDVK